MRNKKNRYKESIPGLSLVSPNYQEKEKKGSDDPGIGGRDLSGTD